MSRELVTVTDGRMSFGDTVARVAESLSPLGAVARIVAESAACDIAIEQLQVAGRRINAEERVRLKELENRRREAAGSLSHLHRRAGRDDRTAQELRRCIANMQRAVVNPRVPTAEKRMCVELIRVFTQTLLSHHSQQGNEMVDTIDRVLNGAGSGHPPRRGPGAAARRGSGAPARRGRGGAGRGTSQ